MTLDAQVDERTLRELYLAPFEAIICEAGAWSVMAAYNGVNGEPMTESSLLGDVLRDDWGYDGLVMSDWFATHSTTASAHAELDLVMPGPSGPWGPALADAVHDGEVAEAEVDAKVVRLLRFAARVGALDAPSAPPAPSFDHARVAGTLRRAAAAGFVLARNEGLVLPLDPSSLTRLAMVGPNAAAARTMGGGSATVFPPYAVSPLEGLRAALGPAVEVGYSIGVSPSARIPVAGSPWVRRSDASEGVEVRFVAADGAVLGSEQRPGCAFTWHDPFAYAVPVERIEVHTVIRATDPGAYTIAGSGIGLFRLSVGSKAVFDGELKRPEGADLVTGLMVPPQACHVLHLGRGEESEVVLSHIVGSAAAAGGGGGVSFQLGLQPPHGTDDEEIERSVALAREADVAIVVVGTTAEVESEGFDRSSLSLPGRQDELVRRVAEVNPATVVVVNAGAPVLMPWAEEVAAVLLVWFPGQEIGNALADVLLGQPSRGDAFRRPGLSPRAVCPASGRVTACSPTTRACSSATARTIAKAGHPGIRLATASVTPAGNTLRSMHPSARRRTQTFELPSSFATWVPGVARRSSSCMRVVRGACSSGRFGGSSASRLSRRMWVNR